MPSPPRKKKRRSLRPENFHLEIPEKDLYEMFKAANEESPVEDLSDEDLKLVEQYQQLDKK